MSTAKTPRRPSRKAAGRNFSKSTPRAIVELNEWNNSTTPIEVGIGDLEACNAFNQAPRLGDVNVPTCVICGEEDLYVDGSQALHDGIIRLPGPLDQPTPATIPPSNNPWPPNQILLDFLNSLD